MIGQKLGRYQITDRIGVGGMATVWKAEDPLLGRIVAIKVLARAYAGSADACRRFRREAELAQLLDHPVITPVLDSGETDGHLWLAMSFVDGRTLADLMLQRLMPWNEAIRIAALVASAIGHAHARGVVHRDISPRNIMVSPDGKVSLLDFGLALVEGGSRFTRTGITLGTVTYMAPEALAGSSEDPRSDLYSLAAVLYEMVTGSPPHRAESVQALHLAKLNTAVVAASSLRPGIPARLDAWFAQALARDVSARFADAEDLLTGLDALVGDEPSLPAELDRVPGQLLSGGHAVVYLGVPAFLLAETDMAALEPVARRLAGALRRRLGDARRLHVLQSAAALRTEQDAREWAAREGANLILMCAAETRGARIRVECTLLDPTGGVALAGEVVEGTIHDPVECEDRLVATARRMLPALQMPFEDADTREITDAAADRFAQAVRYLQRHDHEPSVDAAIGILERLASRHGGMAEYRAALAKAFLAKYALTQQHAWESRAAVEVDRALQLDAARPSVRLVLADLKVVAGRSAEAEELYERALAELPEDFDGWLGLARLHLKRARFEAAELACRRAIALRPRDWRGYSTLGTIYFQQGRYVQAVPPWRRVLRLSPENARAASNLGAAWFHLDRFEDSERAFREALRLEPTAATYANLGTVLYAQHRFADAVEAFEHACDLRPADARFCGYLGAAYRHMPEHEARSRRAFERAVGLMREALERNPEDAEGWAIHASWLAYQGDAAAAREAIRRALEIAPGNIRCIIEAAHTLTQLGDHEQALEHLGRAVSAGYGIKAIERSVELAPLREHPGYAALIQRAMERPGIGELPAANLHTEG